MLKKIFGGKKSEAEREFTVDDLIVLERYDEAEAKLKERMQIRNDLHDHLKLADVYVAQRQVAKAVDEYLHVADEYANDGFYEKALAALGKARRLNPMDDTLPGRMRRMEALRSLERKRSEAMEGFLAAREATEGQGTAVVEFQSIWRQLCETRFARDLSGEQLRLLFRGAESVYLNAGKVLVERGSREEAVYLVLGGELVARLERGEGPPLDLRTFSTGQVVGESVLFEHRPWPARYQARTRCSLFKLTEQGFQTCLTGNPDPRGFLDLLRKERNDQEVARAVTAVES